MSGAKEPGPLKDPGLRPGPWALLAVTVLPILLLYAGSVWRQLWLSVAGFLILLAGAFLFRP